MDTSQFVQRICRDKRLKGSMKQCNGMQMKLNCHQQTNTQKNTLYISMRPLDPYCHESSWL